MIMVTFGMVCFARIKAGQKLFKIFLAQFLDCPHCSFFAQIIFSEAEILPGETSYFLTTSNILNQITASTGFIIKLNFFLIFKCFLFCFDHFG